jgi:acetyl esterase/lipase
MFTAILGWPPGPIFNSEHDVLRDDGETYGLKLLDANVRVTALIPDFVTLNAGTNDLVPPGANKQINKHLIYLGWL